MELIKPRHRLLKPRVLSIDEALELTSEELRALRRDGILPPIAGGAVTAKVYGNFLLGLMSSTPARRPDWAADTINLALVTATYTPNQDTDTFWGDTGISSNELASGGGYTTGGNALATKSSTYDGTSNEARFTATSPVTWTFVGNKAFRYGVVYKNTGTATTSPLIAFIDYGAQSITDSTFNSNIDATHGLVTLTAS
jgi:hypothetical protein